MFSSLDKEKLIECKKSRFSRKDCIMSGLAIFGLKVSSLLYFEEYKEDAVLNVTYKAYIMCITYQVILA